MLYRKCCVAPRYRCLLDSNLAGNKVCDRTVSKEVPVQDDKQKAMPQDVEITRTITEGPGCTVLEGCKQKNEPLLSHCK